MYLDNAATTELTKEVKNYLISILDDYGNPSSQYSLGDKTRDIIAKARNNVAKFINGKAQNIVFTSSGSASNSLIIKGITKERLLGSKYTVLYSPTAHKSMIEAAKSCTRSMPLIVNNKGEINTSYLESTLNRYYLCKPVVCIEWGNSEIGTINDVKKIADIVHKHNGILIVDATGYIPTCQVDMKQANYIDFLTFSGHKLHALKGIGVLYINNNIHIEPLVYGSQEHGIFAGTENVLGIASIGKAVEKYDYVSMSSKNRDYVYDYIIKNIPDCYLVGIELKHRLPHNLYMCFKGCNGESLMTLLDEYGIQVSTGSACNSGNPLPSSTLTSIGMDQNDIHSCVRMTFSGNETENELNYICNMIEQCVNLLRFRKW